MNKNLKLVINNVDKIIEDKHFFEKDELKIILDLYAKMVSEGSWKDYGLSISSKQVGFSVFKNISQVCTIITNETLSNWRCFINKFYKSFF